jgi:hypothetical protein
VRPFIAAFPHITLFPLFRRHGAKAGQRGKAAINGRTPKGLASPKGGRGLPGKLAKRAAQFRGGNNRSRVFLASAASHFFDATPFAAMTWNNLENCY